MATQGTSTGWTVLDIGGADSSCVVNVKGAARGTGVPRVTGVAELSTAEVDADPQSLRRLMHQADGRQPLLVTLARGQYRIRVMPEPLVPPREIASSLKWALAAEAENPMDEFNLAWLRIPTDTQLPARQRQIYAVTVPGPWLATRQAVWREAGLRPKVVDIRETALRNLGAALEQPGESVVLLYADDQGVGFVFTHGGALYMDRYIEQPAADVAQAAPEARARLHERVAGEVLRSIEVVGRTYPFMSDLRVVLGPLPGRPGLAEALQAQLPVTVSRLPLESLFDLGAVPDLQHDERLQARCLVALGASMRGPGRGAA